MRRALALITLASALKLLEVPNGWTATILIAVLLVAPPLWMVVRRRNGLPALGRRVGKPPERTGADPPGESSAEGQSADAGRKS